MARRSVRVDSSEGAGTSSGRMKKKEKKKPIASQKSTKKKSAVVKPPKPAHKARKAGRPRVKYTAADVERLRAELEKCVQDQAAQKKKIEKMAVEHTKQEKKLKRLEKAKEKEARDALKKFAKEETKERIKKASYQVKANLLEATVLAQKELDQTRGLSAYFFNRSEALKREEQVGVNAGAARLYQQCELCEAQWTQVGDSVPRILGCGHTICDKCTQKFVVFEDQIKCPFDGKLTLGAGTIPKNYTLLNI